jgi:hypothetical protein
METSNLTKTAPWDPRLILDLAIGVDSLEEILARYGMSLSEYEHMSTLPVFKKELAQTMRDVRENGNSFRAKAKVQAEYYLQEVDELVNDKTTPAGVRLDAIKSVVKWGDLEPKDAKTDGTGATAVNIQINF